ncbi:MAG: peptidoglycan editing factor PgeF [Clostridiales bacterium]|nr:peptidoglycan editing factor PgeF [Clostridiales bacterium]
MAFIENKSGDILYMTSSDLSVTHAFTTRLGGVSGGIFKSLNLGQNTGDEPACVRRNYELLGSALGIDTAGFVFTRQVHGTNIRHVSKKDMLPVFSPVPYEADGLITAEKDVPLVIFSADCVPILLYDPAGCAIGAVHAGWRGTVRNIAGKAVEEMVRELGSYPHDIRAAIGPCISVCCYETDGDVADAVNRVLGRDASGYVIPRGKKYHTDLKGINCLLLMRAGLKPENISVSPECTSCSSGKYWSHRVTNGKRGSQASLIMMKGSMH